MGDYTPSTEQVRALFVMSMTPSDGDASVPEGEFDRWLESVRADHEKVVRERIVRDIVRELGDGRAADIARRGA